MMSPFVVWSVGVCMLDSPSPRQDMRRYRQPNLGQHTHIALVKHLFKDSFKKGSRHRDQSINHKQCHSLMIHRIGRHLSHAARVVTAVTHRHARWLIKAMRAQYTSTEHYTVTTKHVGICTYGHIGQRWGHLLHSSYVNLSTTAN